MLVVSGGKVTEVEYLNWVRLKLRSTGIEIKIQPDGRSPGVLATRARELQIQDRREAKRSGDARNVFDAIWVVTDVDNFGSDVGAAVDACNSNGIRAAVSNPCFELWLALHRENQTGHQSTDAIQKRARDLGVISGRNYKNIVISQLRGRFEVASKRANALRKMHSRNATNLPNDNPTTNVDELVRYLIETAGRLAPDFKSEM